MKERIILTGTKYFAIATCIIGVTVVMIPCANATPTLWHGNYYELIMATDISWVSASAAAASRTYAGVSGHLATITSAEENAFVASLAPSSTVLEGAWLGGRSPEGWLVGPEAGDAFIYENFRPEENDGYAWIFFGSVGIYPRGGWGDDVDGVSDSGNPIRGYFVEYERAAAVPEPTTMMLLGFGLIGLAGMKRMRS
jgi:hypothetical protein